MKPLIVGIAGGTCSGKSTLAEGLRKKYSNKVASLSFDEYLIDDDLYELDDITNFEDPALYDFPRFIQDLRSLSVEKPIEVRGLSRESRQEGLTKRQIPNKPIIVIDGFLIFYKKEVSDFFDIKIFIDLPDDEVIKRRLKRAKSNKYWDNSDYITNRMLGYSHEYVNPQKSEAGMVINGLKSPEEVLGDAVRYLEGFPEFSSIVS